jgi:hypothetical protein
MTRRRLPDRRPSETFDVESCGLYFTVTASRFDDQRLAEVFIQNHKADFDRRHHGIGCGNRGIALTSIRLSSRGFAQGT